VVTVCGYDKTIQGNYEQFLHSNTLVVEKTGGEYDIDTKKGQSGSIVYLKNNGKMVGIHKGYDPIKKSNVCTMIS